MIVRRLRHTRKITFERVRNVHVDRRAVALHLPVGGHRDLFPFTHVVIGLVEIDRPQLRRLDPMELPVAVQRLNQAGRLLAERGCLTWIRRVMSAGRLFANAKDVRILPVRDTGCGGLCGDAGR